MRSVCLGSKALPVRLGSLDFSYDSSYGTIHSAWTVRGSQAEWNLTIPANTKGQMLLTDSEAQAYILDGMPVAKSHIVTMTNKEGNKTLYVLPAGAYHSTVTLHHS